MSSQKTELLVCLLTDACEAPRMVLINICWNKWVDNLYNNIERQNYYPYFPKDTYEAQINAFARYKHLGGNRVWKNSGFKVYIPSQLSHPPSPIPFPLLLPFYFPSLPSLFCPHVFILFSLSPLPHSPVLILTSLSLTFPFFLLISLYPLPPFPRSYSTYRWGHLLPKLP